MGMLLQDIRHAWRMLTQTPGFALVAIAVLGIGIGANTAIFSVVNSILLQPLPYSEPDRLVRLELKGPNGTSPSVSIPKFMAWKQHTQAFRYMCAYNNSGPGMNLTGQSMPEQVKGIHVSADFFPVFDAAPAFGRVFTADEDRPGGPKLAVLSHGLWMRKFGEDRGAIGRVIVLNGEPYTIVGVLPRGFRSYPPPTSTFLSRPIRIRRIRATILLPPRD
jgi:putative ABC transport system permease protein